MATRKSETGGANTPSAAKGRGKGAAAGGQAGTGGEGVSADTAATGAKGRTGSSRAASGGAGAAAGGAAGKGAGGRKAAGAGAGESGATAGAAGGAKGGGGTRAKSTGPDLQKDLRSFAEARPQGWSHDDWLGFLDDLQSRGHNINDRDQIGAMLERERVAVALRGVEGLSPQRVRSIADRYGSVWRLRGASAEELARDNNISQDQAERIRSALHG